MTRILDDKYTFAFRPAEGGSYQRQCYWEVLHAFFPHTQPAVLAAISTVPHSSIHQALYEHLKGESARSIPRELFGSTPSARLLVARDDNDLIQRVQEILPSQDISLDILDEIEQRLEEATGQALADFGIENGLRQLGQPGGAEEIERRFADPIDVFHTLADVSGEDVGWVALSYHVDAAVTKQIRETLESSSAKHALTLHGSIEESIYHRLYSNPDYLAFVKRVLDAKGGYVSPVVRNFLSFYLRCLKQKIRDHARNSDADASVLLKKLEISQDDHPMAGGPSQRSHHQTHTAHHPAH